MTTSALPAPAVASQVDARLARRALLLLLAINLFNYIDRNVLAAVEPEIRRAFLAGHPHAGFWSGMLSFAFLAAFMLAAPIFGWLADHISRWILMGIGVILWSLASGGSGMDWGVPVAAGYWILLLTRAFVGVGEAAYGPVAPTMLSDLYPVEVRGKIMALFFLALPIGGALGYALGGLMVRTGEEGWRWAFYLVVPPGILLGCLCFLMPEPPRGGSEPANVSTSSVGKARFRDYWLLASIPSYVLNTLGMTMMCFAMGGLGYWMPEFLLQRQAPNVFGIEPRTFFGLTVALAGLVATVLGGLAGDWLRPLHSGSYFLVSGIAMGLGFPMVLLALVVPFPWAWVFIALAVFCLFFNTGPTNTILANVTPSSIRATGYAVNILVIHLLGDAISPSLIGLVKDLSNMDVGFIVVSLSMLIGAALWIWGAFYLRRDTELAPSRLK